MKGATERRWKCLNVWHFTFVSLACRDVYQCLLCCSWFVSQDRMWIREEASFLARNQRWTASQWKLTDPKHWGLSKAQYRSLPCYGLSLHDQQRSTQNYYIKLLLVSSLPISLRGYTGELAREVKFRLFFLAYLLKLIIICCNAGTLFHWVVDVRLNLCFASWVNHLFNLFQVLLRFKY